MQVDDQFRQLLSGTEADPMVVHFADIPRIMVSTAYPVSINAYVDARLCSLCPAYSLW